MFQRPFVLAVLSSISLAAVAQTPLADAIRQGDHAAVKAILAQHPDVNAAEGDGSTALHWAAEKGDVETVQMLLRAGANVKAATRNGGMTPLLLAASNGNGATVDALLKAGADANTANSLSGVTALMRAASAGATDAAKMLLDHGAKVNATEPMRGQTPIIFAAAANQAAMVKLLATRGADLKATTKVTQIVPDKVKPEDEDFPLDAEVILNNNLPPGDKAAKAALAGRRANATVTGGLTALLIAARENNLAAVRALLDAGADINEPSAGDHSTALLLAAINGHWDMAQVPLRGTRIRISLPPDGLAPLYAVIDTQWAPIGGTVNPSSTLEKTTYLDAMEALLKHGADPNARLGKKLWFRPTLHDQQWVGTPGFTAFWRAAQATDLAAMKMLIAYKADPKIASDEGDTALMMATGVGWSGNFTRNAPGAALDAVRYCIELGIDVNVQDVTGYTALGGAAWRGDNDSVKLLLEHGAKIDVRTYRGWSVTDMADGPSLRTTVPVPHPDTVALLLKMGAPALTPHTDEDILGVKKNKPAPKQ